MKKYIIPAAMAAFFMAATSVNADPVNGTVDCVAEMTNGFGALGSNDTAVVAKHIFNYDVDELQYIIHMCALANPDVDASDIDVIIPTVLVALYYAAGQFLVERGI